MKLFEVNQRLQHTDYFVEFSGLEYKLLDFGGLDFGSFVVMRSRSLSDIEHRLRQIGVLK